MTSSKSTYSTTYIPIINHNILMIKNDGHMAHGHITGTELAHYHSSNTNSSSASAANGASGI